MEKPPHDRAALTECLERFLYTCSARNLVPVLIVDEAQTLSDEVLEEFRLLLNLETTGHKLLQIVLLGQPELHHKLAKPTLRHVADRIAVRASINPFSERESYEYIEHRLQIAGGTIDLFSRSALKQIVKASRGVPRALNIHCHNALLFAMGEGEPSVSAESARRAIESRGGSDLKQFEAKRPWLLTLASLILILICGLVSGFLIMRVLEAMSGADDPVEVPASQFSAEGAERSEEAPADAVVSGDS